MKKLVSLVVLFVSMHALAVPFEGHKLVVAGPSQFAVETAKKISKRGGNVADVAVAMGLTLSVTSPYFAALGGGGFAMIKSGNQPVTSLDFREIAPAKMNRDYYKDKSSVDGATAVGVPGFPAGLWAIHKKFGKLPWKVLFEDAISLSENGFQVSGEWARLTSENLKRFDKNAQKYLFEKNQTPLKPGDILKQPQLASALKIFRDKGDIGFYTGVVASDIVSTVKKGGGALTTEDLKNYKVRWLEPITTTFQGSKLYLMPPPSSGGIIIKTALALTEKVELNKYKMLSTDELHMLGEVLAQSFRGRTLMGDPAFRKLPTTFLTSSDYLTQAAKNIDLKKASAKAPLDEKEVKEETETTHYSVLDSDGNAVALTVTLNGAYGSGTMSEKFGIALNNEMDDFTTKPGEPNMFGLIQGLGNAVEPGKRPVSSMSPTLVEKDGKVVMAVGAQGGPRIVSAVFQILYRALALNADIDTAIQAPRVHHQVLPNTLYADRFRLSPDVLELLKKRGHTVEESNIAKAYGVKVNAAGNLEGAFDARGEGAAGGF